jgi:hypothetical protein
MKLLLTIIILSASSYFAHSQNIRRQSIGTIGLTHSNSKYSIQQCVGQPYSTRSSTHALSGYIQPQLKQVPYSKTSTINQLNIYPNPSSTFVQINQEKSIYNATVNVLNISGSIIYQKKFGIIQFNTIDCSEWESGSYIIIVKDSEGSTFQTKFIKL